MANGDQQTGVIDFSAPEFQTDPQTAVAEQGATVDFSAPEFQEGGQEEAGMAAGLARSFVGQGIGLGFGDEVEGFVRSLFSGKTTDEEIDAVRQTLKQFQQENPALSTGAEIAGAFVLPGGAAVRGATMAGRALRGAGVGGVTGAITGAGTAEGGLAERAEGAAEGAALGAVTGAAAVPVVEGVIRGGKAALRGAQRAGAPIRRVVDPEGEAALRVARARERDIALGEPGLGVRGLRQAQQEGLPAANIDVGGRITRRLGRAAANQSPEAGATLEKLVQDRFRGQGARTEAFINDLFGGGRVDSFTMRDTLRTAARRANKPVYDRAYAAGDRSLRSPEIERLISAPAVVDALKGAVQRGKNRVVAEGGGEFNPRVQITDAGLRFTRGADGQAVFPNLRLWDLAKRELDDAANAAARAGRNEEAGAIRTLATDLRSELDTLVPAYAKARGTAQSFFQAGDALEAGQNFARQGKFRIPEARAALDKMSKPERELFAQGFADEIVTKVNAAGDSSNLVTRIFGSPDARARIGVALGPRRARKLEARLHAERVMDFARGAIQGNSTTARQLTELGLLAGGFGATPFDPTSGAGLIATGLLLRGGRALRAGQETRVMDEVAKLLASGDPNAVNQAVQRISRNDALLDRFRKFDAALARAGGQQAAQEATEAEGTQ